MSSRCDVRCVGSEDNVVIAFKYSYDSQNERFFTFKRNKSEKLMKTFTRISLNINNTLNKKIKQKNKSNLKSNEKVIEIQLRDDGMGVNEDSLNSDVWKSGQTLVVGENVFNIFVNAPTVRSIRLPNCIMSSFKVYPNVCLEFCSQNDCNYYWFRRQCNEEKEWVEVGQGFWYNTKCDDIGYKLKVICVPNNGIKSEAISENPIEANPGFCPFEERHRFCSNDSTFGTFRVMSYNILADTYADSDYSRTVLFPYCPPYALSIDYRKQLLIKEIIGYNADICCLQEVDSQVFDSDLKPVMSSLLKSNESTPKYDSVFSEKGTTGEGMATFYSTSKFELLDTKTVSFAEELQKNKIFNHLLEKVNENQKLFERLIARKSVFQCTLLKSLDDTERAVILGNTHLYYHPDADHIRLIQSYIFVKYIENQIKVLTKTRPELKVSPILCGDFNSCPEFGVLRLMTTKSVEKDIEDFKSNSDETIDGFEMSHDLSLGSGCGEPLYTNYTPFFSGCLDYIFYDTNNICVKEVIPFPSHEQVVQNIAIPSVVFPSDHLALICLLQWK